MSRSRACKVHPIIIYPFTQPRDTTDLEALYDGLVKRLTADARYAKPITVVNRQTAHRNAASRAFTAILSSHVEPLTEILHSWSVDACQMWLHGFGAAFDARTSDADVYWLIPADFDYAGPAGREALARLKDMPEAVRAGEADLCIGEVSVPLHSEKHLIDTYGTYGLLYNWFPAEARALRELTDTPRSEFIAISHEYLRRALLNRRWFAYEQTLVLLLQGLEGAAPRPAIRKVELGPISDEPPERRDLAGAMQQVERTERLLKVYWRELNRSRDPRWLETFGLLERQSDAIRTATLAVLQQLLH